MPSLQRILIFCSCTETQKWRDCEDMEEEVVENQEQKFPGLGFAGSSLVAMGDGTQKAIQDVKVNDQILTYQQYQGTFSSTSVTQLFKGETLKTVVLELSDGRKLRVHPTAKLYVLNKGWACMEPEQFKKNFVTPVALHPERLDEDAELPQQAFSFGSSAPSFGGGGYRKQPASYGGGTGRGKGGKGLGGAYAHHYKRAKVVKRQPYKNKGGPPQKAAIKKVAQPWKRKYGGNSDSDSSSENDDEDGEGSDDEENSENSENEDNEDEGSDGEVKSVEISMDEDSNEKEDEDDGLVFQTQPPDTTMLLDGEDDEPVKEIPPLEGDGEDQPSRFSKSEFKDPPSESVPAEDQQVYNVIINQLQVGDKLLFAKKRKAKHPAPNAIELISIVKITEEEHKPEILTFHIVLKNPTNWFVDGLLVQALYQNGFRTYVALHTPPKPPAPKVDPNVKPKVKPPPEEQRYGSNGKSTPLHLVADLNQSASFVKVIVDQLLEKKIDLNAQQNLSNRTAFQEMLRKEKWDVAATLLKAGANVNILDSSGQPLKELLTVVPEKKGNEQRSGLLAKCLSSLDLNFQGKDGKSYLHRAAQCNNPQAITLLLEKGINPNIQDKNKETALHIVVKWKSDYTTVFNTAKELLKAKSNPNILDQNEYSPFESVVRKYNAAFVAEFIKRGGDVNQVARGTTLLHLATLRGELQIATDLVKAGAKINTKDTKGNSPLHLASKLRNDDFVAFFISSKADVNFKNNDDQTPLHFAINFSSSGIDSSFSLERKLINAGANVNAKDKWSRTPLHYAFASIGDKWYANEVSKIDPIDTVSGLCSAPGILTDEPDKYGKTPLHYAAQRAATICSLYFLSEKRKARLDLLDSTQNTPLGIGLRSCHPDYAIMLIQSNAKMNFPVNFQTRVYDLTRDKLKFVYKREKAIQTKVWTFFRQVVEHEWTGVAYTLLDSGFDFFAALEDSILAKKLNFMNTILEKTLDDDILKRKNPQEQTLFHPLCNFPDDISSKPWKPIVDRLISSGVNPKDVDSFGNSPLHYASIRCHEVLVSFLIEKKLNVNDKDKKGDAPLILSIKHGNYPASYATASTLIRAGAKIVNDYKKISPLVLLINRRHSYDINDFLGLLLRKGVNPNEVSRDGNSPLCDLLSYYDFPHLGKYLTTMFSHSLKPNCNLKNKSGDSALKELDQNVTDSLSWTASVHAFVLKKQNLLTKLIRAGADPNIPDKDGETLLMKMVTSNDFVGLQTLTDNTRIPINFKLTNKEGKTLIHRVVNPLTFGSFENVHILRHLVKLGADVNQPDNAKKAPLYYALMQDSGTMAQALKDLGAKNIPKPPLRESSVLPGSLWESTSVRLDQDFDEVLTAMGSATVVKHVTKVDPNFNQPNMKHVQVYTSPAGVVYDILMSKTDVKYGVYGLNNFYVMQVIHETVKDIYLLLNRWGRTGDDGQIQVTPMGSCEEACKEFASVFKTKSGNVWPTTPAEFKKLPKKWMLQTPPVKRDYTSLQMKPWDLEASPATKLPISVQSVIGQFSEIKLMNQSLEQSGIDLPFSQINKSVIEKATFLLNSLKDSLKVIEEEQAKPAIQCDLTVVEDTFTKMNDLSNDYYDLIPHHQYRNTALPPLLSQSAIDNELKILSDLSDVSTASRILMAASSKLDTIHPFDYVYRALNVQIEPLIRASPEFKALSKYAISTSQGQCHKIKNIFKLQRKGEPERMEQWKSLANHYLLWHGSRASNFIGILSEGLRVAPPHAPVSGYAFGKGIYFADMMAKSLGYTHPSLHGSKFLLLCEVALGNINKLNRTEYMEAAPEGFNSCQALGHQGPDFADSIVLPNGVTIPIGAIQKLPPIQAVFGYNEYIVYNNSQVRMRYLVEI